MQTPIPEPYDITEIPYIAWVPGATTWGAVVIILGVLAWWVWKKSNPHIMRGDTRILDKLLAELRSSVASTKGINHERTSRIARRIISHISGGSFAELTSDELRAYAAEDIPEALRKLMLTLAQFEDTIYAPPTVERDGVAKQLAGQLASHVTDYRNGLRKR